MSRKKERLSTNSVEEFGSNPFEGLESKDLTSLRPVRAKEIPQVIAVASAEKVGRGERLEVRREKSGRGGKIVTTVGGFPSRISQDDFKRMLRELKTRLATGGGWHNDQMEIQGDQRESICQWLTALGFRPVLAGG